MVTEKFNHGTREKRPHVGQLALTVDTIIICPSSGHRRRLSRIWLWTRVWGEA